jgi:predicted DNA-binding transcriptional regulator AlpA
MTRAQSPTIDLSKAEEWLLSSQVKAIFKFSDMALWRWLDDEELGFPKPIKVMGRNYWRQCDIAAFQERMIKEAMNSRKK